MVKKSVVARNSELKKEDVSSITGWHFGACIFMIVYIMQ